MAALVALVAAVAAGREGRASPPFVLPGKAPVFGHAGGLQAALWPEAFDGRPEGGPRGLIRIGLPHGGRMHLVNYLAVEPEVRGRRGLSELEAAADGRPGLPMRVVSWGVVPAQEGTPAELRVRVEVADFANGAAVDVELSFVEGLPDRVRLRTFTRSGSRPPDRVVLTATMGNQARARLLWLADGAVDARTLLGRPARNGFAEAAPIPASRLARTGAGDVAVAITSDEVEPSEVSPLPAAPEVWRHTLPAVTQWWMKRAGQSDAALAVRINGRQLYWGGGIPVPGGIAIENFELLEPFRAGAECWFGASTQPPWVSPGIGRAGDVPQRRPGEEELAILRGAAASGRQLQGGDFAQGVAGWTLVGQEDSVRLFTRDGIRAVTTHGARGDADRARLRQAFVVPADAVRLSFFLHGGSDPARLRVSLLSEAREERWMTGSRSNQPFLVRWDVTALRGRPLLFELRDDADGAWGFLGLDSLHWERQPEAPGGK